MILRNLCRTSGVPLKALTNTRTIFTSNRLLDDSSSDDDKPKTVKDENKEVVNKLNDLLHLMSKKQEPTKLASKIKLPKPREKARKEHFEAIKNRELKLEQLEEEKIGNQLANAASEVAESLGGDTKQTEMELLDIYLKRRKPSDSAKQDEKSVPLSELLSGMKVEKEAVPSEVSRAHQVKSMMEENQPKQFKRQPIKSRKYVRVDIFGEKPFGFFDAQIIEENNITPVKLSTWDHLYDRDVKLAITQPPRNIFEQLVLWTDQGKIWRFPIDNEQDWHEEAKYDFTDHVFLERWLEPWCPESGPIRHFMELVCTGLSKNPYLTVPEKHAHIFWYEHYFRSKKALLLETGVGEIKDRPQAEDRA